MKNLLIATINENAGRGRIRLVCRKDGDRFRWYGPSNDDLEGPETEDTEVSGGTLVEAKQRAIASWGSNAWDLRARWLNSNAPLWGAK